MSSAQNPKSFIYLALHTVSLTPKEEEDSLLLPGVGGLHVPRKDTSRPRLLLHPLPQAAQGN